MTPDHRGSRAGADPSVLPRDVRETGVGKQVGTMDHGLPLAFRKMSKTTPCTVAVGAPHGCPSRYKSIDACSAARPPPLLGGRVGVGESRKCCRQTLPPSPGLSADEAADKSAVPEWRPHPALPRRGEAKLRRVREGAGGQCSRMETMGGMDSMPRWLIILLR